MRKGIVYTVILSLLLLTPIPMFAQEVKGEAKKENSEEKEKKEEKKSGVISLDEFLKKESVTKEGFTTIYIQDEKYFLGINDSILNKDILLVSRVSKSAAGIRASFAGYAGDILNEYVVRFEKGTKDKIFLRVLNGDDFSEEGSPIYENLQNSNLQPILESFDVKAYNADSTSAIIDVTDFFMADSEVLFFSKSGKNRYGLKGYEKDKSYFVSAKTFPINTEIRVVKTFATSKATPATFEINCSFVKLPDEPMVPRYYDDRVGYFVASQTNFDKNPQRVERVRMITRYRLEPKPEDMEKYLKGELVEPAKQIVYYIDPSTPKQWVPYLIQGVNDWNKAFEKAGFKNAICGKVAPTPEEDPTWSLEDARHSAIVYKPSDIANASGPHVHDPRSGEIIESHVNWYHNVMSLVHDWYFIQCAAVDPAARKMVFDEELMGQLIRFVSSHEVGHTLGLRHNFAGTSFYTAKQLRDPKFLKENGHTTSIMDYSRFNFVAQPGDNIPQELLFPRISHYDEWAIEWGYRLLPQYNDPEAELTYINNWIIEKTKNPYYRFGTESSSNDPRYQSEDLGSNQMETGIYAIRNLQFIMNNLIEWTSEPNEDYSNLKSMYGQLVTQYNRYLGHVAKWIGGVYETPKRIEMEGDVYEFVEKEKQEEAISFLNRYLFNVPMWLVPEEIMDKISTSPESTLESSYKKVFSAIISKRVMRNLYEAEAELGDDAYTMENLYSDLDKYILSDISKGKEVHPYKRIQQKCYIQAIIDLISGKGGGLLTALVSALSSSAPIKDNTDVMSVAFYQLQLIRSTIASATTRDMTTRAHYNYLIKMIDTASKEAFESKK